MRVKSLVHITIKQALNLHNLHKHSQTMSWIPTFITSIICCFMMNKKEKDKKKVEKMEAVKIEDHVHVHEAIVEGPHGHQVIAFDALEDYKVQEEIKKDERLGSVKPSL